MHSTLHSRPAARVAAVTLVTMTVLLATGCESMSARERGTAQGAGVGAVAGAVLGSATGGKAGSGAVIGGALGAVVGNLWSKRMQDKQDALARASAGTPVEVVRTADNQLRLNVPADFSFAVGRADIRSDMRPVLDEISRNLDPTVRVTIVGHTDSTGASGMNEQLAMDRASSVRDYISARGVAPSRVSVQGRGEREPVASNDTDAGRAANRRVEIYLAETAV
jgi:outer membrane protein OmpA-like peptidoglycan-associated protein